MITLITYLRIPEVPSATQSVSANRYPQNLTEWTVRQKRNWNHCFWQVKFCKTLLQWGRGQAAAVDRKKAGYISWFLLLCYYEQSPPPSSTCTHARGHAHPYTPTHKHPHTMRCWSLKLIEENVVFTTNPFLLILCKRTKKCRVKKSKARALWNSVCLLHTGFYRKSTMPHYYSLPSELSLRISLVCQLSFMSHSRTVLSQDTLANTDCTGLKHRLLTGPSWPLSTCHTDNTQTHITLLPHFTCATTIHLNT